MKVQLLFSKNLELTTNIIVHWVGRITSDPPRPVIVRLKNIKDRYDCLKDSPKFKGTDIFINEDVFRIALDIR